MQVIATKAKVFGWFGNRRSHPTQTRPLLRGLQTQMQQPVKSAVASNGILLALDGHCLERQAIPYTLQYCRRNGKRLDILLVNPPKPATLMLGKLLKQLEQEGIDYRLTSGEGNLADELLLYLHRFKYISCVLLDCLDKWEAMLHPTLAALHLEGYRVLTLPERDKGIVFSNAEWSPTG